MGLFGFDVGFGILQGLFFLAFAVFLVFFIITAAKGIGIHGTRITIHPA